MVKKNNEMITEIRENMRDGKGNVEITHIYKNDELKGNVRLCARVKINPGCSIGVHEHVQEEEIYYILSGRGIVIDDGIPKELGVGDAVLTRDGASHSIECIGDEPLILMAIINLY